MYYLIEFDSGGGLRLGLFGAQGLQFLLAGRAAFALALVSLVAAHKGRARAVFAATCLLFSFLLGGEVYWGDGG